MTFSAGCVDRTVGLVLYRVVNVNRTGELSPVFIIIFKSAAENLNPHMVPKSIFCEYEKTNTQH